MELVTPFLKEPLTVGSINGLTENFPASLLLFKHYYHWSGRFSSISCFGAVDHCRSMLIGIVTNFSEGSTSPAVFFKFLWVLVVKQGSRTSTPYPMERRSSTHSLTRRPSCSFQKRSLNGSVGSIVTNKIAYKGYISKCMIERIESLLTWNFLQVQSCSW